MINGSIVMLLRGQVARLRKQIEAGEEHDCSRELCKLADEADDLARAIDNNRTATDGETTGAT